MSDNDLITDKKLVNNSLLYNNLSDSENKQYWATLWIPFSFDNKTYNLTVNEYNNIQMKIKFHKNIYFIHKEKKIKLLMDNKSEHYNDILKYLRNNKTNKDIVYKIWQHNYYELKIVFSVKNDFYEQLCLNYTILNEMNKKMVIYYGKTDMRLRAISNVNNEVYITNNIIEDAINIEISSDHFIYSNKDDLIHMPYNYQLNNVIWFNNIENMIDKNILEYKFIDMYGLLKMEINKKTYYYDDKIPLLYNEESIENYKPLNHKLLFKGGCLADEVGIGKTLSMIYYINYSLNKARNARNSQGNDITLIICPKRLVNHWSSEFKKFIKPDKINVIEVNIITDIKYKAKRKEEDFLNADVIIFPLSLLGNDDYHKIVYSDDLTFLNTHFNILNYNYKRVIIDEGHEVLFKNAKLKEHRNITKLLFEIKSQYRWVISGTPFNKGNNNLLGLYLYLLGYDNINNVPKIFYNLLLEDMMDINKLVIRRNTEISIKKQITIPKIIKKTKYLKMSVLEKSLYNNAVHTNDIKLQLQLCSNIYVNDNIADLLGNRKLSPAEINNELIKTFVNKNIANEANLVKLEQKLQSEVAKFPIELNLLEDELKTYKKMNMTTELEDTKEKIKKLRAHIIYERKHFEERTAYYKEEIKYNKSQIIHYTDLKNSDILNQDKYCLITGAKLDDYIITKSNDFYSKKIIDLLLFYKNKCNKNYILCPKTGERIPFSDLMYVDNTIKESKAKIETKQSKKLDKFMVDKWGTKMTYLSYSINKIFMKKPENKIIIFTQWKKTVNIIVNMLAELNINYVVCIGNIYVMKKAINTFKTDISIKIIILCSEECSSGINLIEATHIIFIDTVNENINSVKATQEQAIARAVRLGQKNNVVVYNYIMDKTIEQELFLKI